MNKKRKFFERRQSSNPAASSSVGEPKQIFGPENDSNDSSSVFSERWQVFMDEAANFRQVQAEKKAKLDEKFETFVDQSPSFPKDNRKIIVPDSLNGIDRVEVSHQMKECYKMKTKLYSKQDSLETDARVWSRKFDNYKQRKKV